MDWSRPLPAEEFVDLFHVSEATFTPARFDEYSGLRSGQPLKAELASPLWRADITTTIVRNDDGEALAALFEALEHPGRDFFIYNPRKVGPRLDPDGDLLLGRPYLHTSLAWDDGLIWNNAMPWGGAFPVPAPTIHSVAENNRELRIQGLLAGYVLSRGDMVAFDYGPPEQMRRALHRVVDMLVTTGPDGITPLFEVYPFVRPGWASGNPVHILLPSMRATLVPGTYRPAGVGALDQRFTFSAIQKLV